MNNSKFKVGDKVKVGKKIYFIKKVWFSKYANEYAYELFNCSYWYYEHQLKSITESEMII